MAANPIEPILVLNPNHIFSFQVPHPVSIVTLARKLFGTRYRDEFTKEIRNIRISIAAAK